MAGPLISLNPEFTEQVRQLETKLAKQVTFASTPRDAAVLRRKTILAYGVVGSRRHYAFATEHDREQFVYDRHDTLFTVNRDLRKNLALDAPEFKGTVVNGTVAPLPTKKKNKFRK